MTVARHSESRRLRKQLVFRLTDGLAADVEQLAEQRGCSVATLLREGAHLVLAEAKATHSGNVEGAPTKGASGTAARDTGVRNVWSPA